MYILKNNQICLTDVSQYSETIQSIYIFEPSNAERKYELFDNLPGVQKLVNPWTYWDTNTKLSSIRLQRNYLLAQTDWTALNDVPLSPSEKTAYENYRQQLRDFPDTVNVNLPIEQIIWPSKP